MAWVGDSMLIEPALFLPPSSGAPPATRRSRSAGLSCALVHNQSWSCSSPYPSSFVPAIFTTPPPPVGPPLIVIVIVPTAPTKWSPQIESGLREWRNLQFEFYGWLWLSRMRAMRRRTLHLSRDRERERERMLNFSWKCNKVTFYDRLGLFVSLRFTAPSVRPTVRQARPPFVMIGSQGNQAWGEVTIHSNLRWKVTLWLYKVRSQI